MKLTFFMEKFDIPPLLCDCCDLPEDECHCHFHDHMDAVIGFGIFCGDCGNFIGTGLGCARCRTYNKDSVELERICLFCDRVIGTTPDCPICIVHNYNAVGADDFYDLDENGPDPCMVPEDKLRRAAKVEMRKTDKRNRRDRRRIHWPLGWGVQRRAPRQHFICHHCGSNRFSCGCLKPHLTMEGQCQP